MQDNDDDNNPFSKEMVEYLPQSWSAQEAAVYKGPILSTLRNSLGLPVTEGNGEDNDRVTVGNIAMRVSAAIKAGFLERDPTTGKLVEIDQSEIAERVAQERVAREEAIAKESAFAARLHPEDGGFLKSVYDSIKDIGRDPFDVALGWITDPESEASRSTISTLAVSTGQTVEAVAQQVRRTAEITVDLCAREAAAQGVENYSDFTAWLYDKYPQHRISSLYLQALGGLAAPLHEAVRRYKRENPGHATRRPNTPPPEVLTTADGREYVMHGKMAVSVGVAQRLGLI